MRQLLKKILEENGFISPALVARKMGCSQSYAKKIIENDRKEQALMEETERLLVEIFG